MSRRKPIKKRGVSECSERDALFRLMTTPCRSEKCSFRSGYHYLCDRPSEKKHEYESWCRDLVQNCADPHATKPSVELDALRRFRQDGVPLACTIEAIRDFVFYDLTASNIIADVQNVRSAVRQSFHRIKTVYAKCNELGIKQVAELDSFTERVNSSELWREKEDLTRLMIRTLETAKEIYEYELERLDEMNGDSISLAQAVHLEFMLPPEITSSGGRYWKEIAALLNAGERVWRGGKKKLRGLSRAYNEDSLQKLSERFNDEERGKLRDLIDISGEFPRVFDLDVPGVRELLAEKTCFRPSRQAEETLNIARAVRCGQIRFEPGSST